MKMLKRIKFRSLIGNHWIVLIVAVLIALGLTAVVYQLLTKYEKDVERGARERAAANAAQTVLALVPRANFPAGTVIDANTVATRPIAADLAYATTMLAADFEQVKGMRLAESVRAGRPLLRSSIDEIGARDFADMVPPGSRALTVEVSDVDSAAHMIRAGNYIDLYVVAPSRQAANGKSTQLLLSNLLVLATGQHTKRHVAGSDTEGAGVDDKQMSDYATLTLQVTSKQGASIIVAQQAGSLRALLRNPKDSARTPAIRENERTVLDGWKDGNEVEFITGGGSASDVTSKTEESKAMPAAGVSHVNGGGMAAVPSVDKRRNDAPQKNHLSENQRLVDELAGALAKNKSGNQ
ncbi:Flp pilus assembly protein CpaB [Burkholderia metallica]|uniref:Flp pilus assembly protein CpaB n=1 Tax=Burkholderia metallica TaxID=488729 RepID=UPI00157B50D2|nr:Flp pilus assembly protein CpaB [Burkholderia metallica]NTZ88883.1 Flp pilus assembly protein CpaB [Burkholderia metallica]